MNKVFASLAAAALLVFGFSPAATAQSAIKAVAHPILLPDLTTETCNFSTVELSLRSKGTFKPLESFSIKFSVEEGPIAPNLAFQYTGEPGLSRIFWAPGSRSGPNSHFVNIQLCSSDITEPNPTYLWIYLDLLSENGVRKDFVKVKMPILYPSAGLIANNELLKTCSFGTKEAAFGNNVIFDIKVAKVLRDKYTRGTIGMQFELEGTLVRQGIVSPDDHVYFVTNSGKQQVLAKAKTDQNGQFRAKFKFPRTGGSVGSSSDVVGIVVTARAMKIGGLTVLMPSSMDGLGVEWLLYQGVTQAGRSNWIPQLSEECLGANSISLLENTDERNYVRRVLISAALGLLGTRNKEESNSKSYTNRSGASTSGGYSSRESAQSRKSSVKAPSIGRGGRCYVRGHYRSGSYVKGYYRRC